MTAATGHHDWLLERLTGLLGAEVARGTLAAGYEQLGVAPDAAGEPEYRALLRGPLRERLRLSLGSRGALLWVRDLELERFGPEPTPHRPEPVESTESAEDSPEGSGESSASEGTARRATDLSLSLARVRAEVARRGVERLRANDRRTELTLLMAEHATTLAEAEARRLEGQQDLARLRGLHLRREAWQEIVVARAQERWLELALEDARARGAAPEAENLAFTLVQVRDFLDALRGLSLREVPLGPPPGPVDLAFESWITGLSNHPAVMAAQGAVERAALNVAAADSVARPVAEATRARAHEDHEVAVKRASAELGARLDALRGLAAHVAALGSACAAAETRLQKVEDADDLAVMRARYEAWHLRAQWHAEGHRLAEGVRELRLVFGG